MLKTLDFLRFLIIFAFNQQMKKIPQFRFSPQLVENCGKEVANFGKMWEIVGNSFFI